MYFREDENNVEGLSQLGVRRLQRLRELGSERRGGAILGLVRALLDDETPPPYENHCFTVGFVQLPQR